MPDVYVAGMLDRLNLRFGPGDAIEEMLELQREFKVFSEEHSLKDAFGLLNMAPTDNWAHRRGWYRYLDYLKGQPSDRPTENGHDRVISALKEHLAANQPVPVHFRSHNSEKNDRVRVLRPRHALVYSLLEFLIISLPMTPVEKDRMKRRGGRQ